MAKIFIYKDYDLIKEIEKIINEGIDEGNCKKAYWILRKGLTDLRENIKEAVKVIVKE